MSRVIFDMIHRGQTAELAAEVEAIPQLAAARDAQGVSALLWSIYTGQTAARDILLTRLSELDLFEAAATGNVEEIRRNAGADPASVRSYSGDGWTPLHLASAFGSPQAAAALLAFGADVNARSKNPLANQPLHAAIALGNSLETVRLLLDAGAEIDATQAGGYTPLHQAAAAGKRELVELLLARGADTEVRCDREKTAADYARERGHAQVLAVLEAAKGGKLD